MRGSTFIWNKGKGFKRKKVRKEKTPGPSLHQEIIRYCCDINGAQSSNFLVFLEFFTLSQKIYTHGVTGVTDKYQVWVEDHFCDGFWADTSIHLYFLSLSCQWQYVCFFRGFFVVLWKHKCTYKLLLGFCSIKYF